MYIVLILLTYITNSFTSEIPPITHEQHTLLEAHKNVTNNQLKPQTAHIRNRHKPNLPRITKPFANGFSKALLKTILGITVSGFIAGIILPPLVMVLLLKAGL